MRENPLLRKEKRPDLVGKSHTGAKVTPSGAGTTAVDRPAPAVRRLTEPSSFHWTAGKMPFGDAQATTA